MEKDIAPSIDRLQPTVSTSTMNCLPIVHCPQPKLPLKRSLLELNEAHDSDQFKRQCIFTFLDGIPEPLSRSRSDSYLCHAMSSKPDRVTKSIQRYDEQEFPTTRSAKSPTENSPNVVSTPVLSAIRAMGRLQTETSFQTPSSVTRQSYRTLLKDHGIRFIGSRTAPTALTKSARKLLDKSRRCPKMSNKEAETAARYMETLRHESDEMQVAMAYASHVLPDWQHQKITKSQDRPFDPRALSRVSNIAPISTPKPDMFYAYSSESFNAEQRGILDRGEFQPYCVPVVDRYLPYFTIEFKSIARGGNAWVAENQVAGNGAVCVKGMDKLFTVLGQRSQQMDTISFSCVMDERYAAMWCHFLDKKDEIIFNVELDQYCMEKSEDIIRCQNHIQNIHTWALETRLPKILKALNKTSTASTTA